MVTLPECWCKFAVVVRCLIQAGGSVKIEMLTVFHLGSRPCSFGKSSFTLASPVQFVSYS